MSEHDQHREAPIDVCRRLGPLRLRDRPPTERGQRDRYINERHDLERDIDRIPVWRLERQQRGRKRGERCSVGAKLGDAGMRGRGRWPRALALVQRKREQRGLSNQQARGMRLTHGDEQDGKGDADAWTVSVPGFAGQRDERLLVRAGDAVRDGP